MEVLSPSDATETATAWIAAAEKAENPTSFWHGGMHGECMGACMVACMPGRHGSSMVAWIETREGQRRDRVALISA